LVNSSVWRGNHTLGFDENLDLTPVGGLAGRERANWKMTIMNQPQSRH
jgi:hypothetical protein